MSLGYGTCFFWRRKESQQEMSGGSRRIMSRHSKGHFGGQSQASVNIGSIRHLHSHMCRVLSERPSTARFSFSSSIVHRHQLHHKSFNCVRVSWDPYVFGVWDMFLVETKRKSTRNEWRESTNNVQTLRGSLWRAFTSKRQ